VREWIAAYGDPRGPDVDPIDWVERIPFAETRNYVQRVMENLQVYRARLAGGRTALAIGQDMAAGRKSP
jgi:soluble lytic murein transglycosylase